jgi:hypothetical protein
VVAGAIQRPGVEEHRPRPDAGEIVLDFEVVELRARG